MEACLPAGPGTLGCLLFARVLQAAGTQRAAGQCSLTGSPLVAWLYLSVGLPCTPSLRGTGVFSVSVAPGQAEHTAGVPEALVRAQASDWEAAPCAGPLGHRATPTSPGLAAVRGTEWWAGPEQVRDVCSTHCSAQKGDCVLERTVTRSGTQHCSGRSLSIQLTASWGPGRELT